MAHPVINYRFRMRRRSAAEWISINEVLLDAEVGVETDTRRTKTGDGGTAWNDLDYDVSGALQNGADFTDGQGFVWSQALGMFVPGDLGKTYQPGTGISIDNPNATNPTISNTLASLSVIDRLATYAQLPTSPLPAAGDAYLVDGPPKLVYVYSSANGWPGEGDGIPMPQPNIVGAGLVLDVDSGIVRVASPADIHIDTTLISLQLGQAGTFQMQASGGSSPYHWMIDPSSSLPAGMTMDSTGLITDAGLASAGAQHTIFRITDANGQRVSRLLSVVVAQQHIARWWRIKITEVGASPTIAVTELTLSSTPGGPDIAVGAFAYASSVYSAAYSASYAFDGMSGANRWSSLSNPPLPMYLGCELPTASNVAEISIEAPSNHSSSHDNSIKSFTVQSSQDSTTGFDGTWVDEWSVTGQTGWSANEVRTFTRS